MATFPTAYQTIDIWHIKLGRPVISLLVDIKYIKGGFPQSDEMFPLFETVNNSGGSPRIHLTYVAQVYRADYSELYIGQGIRHKHSTITHHT